MYFVLLQAKCVCVCMYVSEKEICVHDFFFFQVIM